LYSASTQYLARYSSVSKPLHTFMMQPAVG